MKKPLKTSVTYKVPEGKKLVEQNSVTLHEDTILCSAVAAYLLIALGTFGSLAADYDKSLCHVVQTIGYTLQCGSGVCQQTPATGSQEDCKSWDPFVGRFLPLIGGVAWPIYWPLHLAVKVFS